MIVLHYKVATLDLSEWQKNCHNKQFVTLSGVIITEHPCIAPCIRGAVAQIGGWVFQSCGSVGPPGPRWSRRSSRSRKCPGLWPWSRHPFASSQPIKYRFLLFLYFSSTVVKMFLFKYFRKFPLACLGSMAAAVEPNGTITKYFTQPLDEQKNRMKGWSLIRCFCSSGYTSMTSRPRLY